MKQGLTLAGTGDAIAILQDGDNLALALQVVVAAEDGGICIAGKSGQHTAYFQVNRLGRVFGSLPLSLHFLVKAFYIYLQQLPDQ